MRDGTVVREELVEASGEPGAGEKQYPYPAPRDRAAASRIVELVDRLLRDEKDEAWRKLLRELRELAVQAGSAYPAPPVGEESSAGLAGVRETLRAVARALGMEDVARGEAPELGKEIDAIRKRIDRLAGVEGEEEDGGRASFKGLL